MTKKIYKIQTANDSGSYSNHEIRYSHTEGTLEELIDYFSYTLKCGASWQHESGNKKINRNPKSIKTLITNINNAVNNSAANGYSSHHYSVV